MKHINDFIAFNPEEGLTARDFFAAIALHAALGKPDSDKHSMDDLTQDAYAVADHMLEERLKA